MARESDERQRDRGALRPCGRGPRLSAREREVLELVALGRTPMQIERELVIANGTLKSHMQRIYQKLGIHSKRELRAMVGAGGVRASAGRLPIAEVAAPEAVLRLSQRPLPAPLRRGILYPSGTLQCKVIWL